MNPYAKKRVAISNPYAKKNSSSTHVTNNNNINNAVITPKAIKRSTATTASTNNVSNDVNSNRQINNNRGGAAGATVAAPRPKNNPYATTARSNSSNVTLLTKAVTPTPKKQKLQSQQQHQQHGQSASKSVPSRQATAAVKVGGGATTAATKKAVIKNPINNSTIPRQHIITNKQQQHHQQQQRQQNHHQQSNITKASNNTITRPTSLKQSLKSQIAQIKRRKQLLVQQRHDEKQRKLRQIEQAKLRKQQEHEAKLRLQKQQRHEVQCTLNHIMSRVESRMTMEQTKFGLNGSNIHYHIGETMEYIVNNIELVDLQMKRKVREEKLRLKRIEKQRKRDVYDCLLDLVTGVERRIYGVSSQEMLIQQQQQQQQMKMRQMMVQQQQMYTQQQQTGMIVPPYNNGPCYLPPGSTTNAMQYPVPMTMPGMQQHPNNNNGLLPYSQRNYALPPTQSVKPMAKTAIVATTAKAANKPLVLSAHALTNPHSPYVATHQLINGHICVMKKEVKDSFGVTLRYESRSVLVPRSEDVGQNDIGVLSVATAVVSGVQATTTGVTLPTATEKKPRRKREMFGCLVVVEATKARVSAPAPEAATTNNESQRTSLQPGDVILSINDRDVGGMTFTQACQYISTSSVRCSNTGEIRCLLTVARRKVPLPLPATSALVTGARGVVLGNSSTNLLLPTAISTPTIPLIPFNIFGGKVIGDFTPSEWCALIRGYSTISRSLTTGMALLPVLNKNVCTTMKQDGVYMKFLSQRSVDSMTAKMAYEGRRVDGEVRKMATEYWEAAWEAETKIDADNGNNSLVENYLTDAQRSLLRSKARPSKGCKCGSQSHNFVNDPKCVLYRDVKQFCAQNSINIEEEKKGKGKKISTKGKGRLEAAYIRRFNQLRAETAATKEEAEFVLKMEQNQSLGMKKAVFAPSSLCTIVLSAVATVMDRIPKEYLLDSEKAEVVEEKANMVIESKPDDDKDEVSKLSLDSDDDDSDDEDMPLNALLLKPQPSLKRAAADNSKKLPSPKRHKQAEADATSNNQAKSKAVPSGYVLGEILHYISKTYGHLFLEPSHSNYAWQQRHRSVIRSPLSKEVMFKGNPRKPGTLSFENLRFVLTEERLARLKDNWLNPDNLRLPPQSTMERWNDEWTVAHLSSDTVTGVAHEINVLENLGILEIYKNGTIVLAQGWERRIPHMILNEMKDMWGSDMDVNNLHCIHERVISSLEDVWEYSGDEEGWRFESGDLDDELVFEDEEYELRRQIFLENYDGFVNSTKGVGNFGI